MVRLQEQVLEDKEIVLTNDCVNFLGPKLTAKNCRFILRSTARGIVVSNPKLVSCQIEAKKKLVNFREWCKAKISDCTFQGKFFSNEFGHWPPFSNFGSISNCNFENAILHGCRFWNCDISKMKFPCWPCFTFIEPLRHRETLEAVLWTADQQFSIDFILDPEVNKGLSAACYYAPEFVKDDGGSEEELKDKLAALEFVLF